jgi:hypothetical protein
MILPVKNDALDVNSIYKPQRACRTWMLIRL